MRRLTFLVFFVLFSLTFVYAQPYEFSIANGWNLISYNDDYLVQGWNGPVMYKGYWFDPWEKKYYELGPKDEFTARYDSLTEEQKAQLPSTGVWLWFDNVEWTIFPADTTRMLPLEDIMLNEGWNLLSAVPEMSDQTITSLGGDCDFEKIYFFNPSSQEWIKIRVNEDDIESNMIGMAFAVKVSEDCSFSGATNPGAPPSIPAN